MGVGAPVDEGTNWWVWVHDAQNVASGSVSGAFPEDGPIARANAITPGLVKRFGTP
jgi:hypothetical protein